MNYNIWFDVCALLLMSFLLLQFVLRRAFNIFQSNTFLLMMIGMWYASFFSLLTIVLEGKSYIFVLITNYLVIIVDGLVGAFFVIYVLSIINYKEYKRLAITTVLVPIVSMVVLLTLNVFLNDFLFTVDKEKAVYVSGNYLVLLYIFVYLHYVFAVFNIFITNRKFISKELKLISPLMLITAIAGVIVELINPTLVVQQFVLSLLVLDAYFSLQNPNEFFPYSGGYKENTSKKSNIYPGGIFNIPFKIKKNLSYEYRNILRTKIIPRLYKFKPDIIFISSGFDGHKNEIINKQNMFLNEFDFAYITQEIQFVANKFCEGRVVSVLEGGYNASTGLISSFAQSVFTHARFLNLSLNMFHCCDVKLTGLKRKYEMDDEINTYNKINKSRSKLKNDFRLNEEDYKKED